MLVTASLEADISAQALRSYNKCFAFDIESDFRKVNQLEPK